MYIYLLIAGIIVIILILNQDKSIKSLVYKKWESQEPICLSILHAMKIVHERRFQSVAIPIIGSCSGSYKREKALNSMLEEFRKTESNVNVIVVKYKG